MFIGGVCSILLFSCFAKYFVTMLVCIVVKLLFISVMDQVCADVCCVSCVVCF